MDTVISVSSDRVNLSLNKFDRGIDIMRGFSMSMYDDYVYYFIVDDKIVGRVSIKCSSCYRYFGVRDNYIFKENIFSGVISNNDSDENEEEEGLYTKYFSESMYLYSFEVLECYRGMGYGKMFLQEIFRYLVSKGVLRVRLAVDFGNDVAERLYNSVGFSCVNEDGYKKLMEYNFR